MDILSTSNNWTWEDEYVSEIEESRDRQMET